MNKITILLVFTLFITNITQSQNKTRDEVIQLMADDTCECIKKDPDTFSKAVDMSKKEIALGLCIFNSFEKRKQLSKEFKNKKTADTIDAVAEEVGINMISTCGTEFMSAFTVEELMDSNDNKEDLSTVPPPPAPKNDDDFQMEAKLISVHNDAVSFIKVEDDFNKEHIYLIVNQFEGKEFIKQSNKNKKIKIYYKENNFYDISEQRYVKKRVVSYIESI